MKFSQDKTCFLGQSEAMKKIALILLLFFGKWAMAYPSQIILIRHAEKPDTKSPDLSDVGFQRAQALTKIFDIYPDLIRNGKPDFIFATKYVAGDSSRRTEETVTPLAKVLNLEIQNQYLTEEYQNLADDLLKDPRYNGKSIFIAWTHTYIVQLAQALGSAPKLKWKSDVFDRLWVIQYDANGKPTSVDLPQKLMPGDSTHLIQF